MITDEARMEYWKQYGAVYYGEPGDGLFVEDDDGNAYQAPEGETDAIFRDRIRRSKEAGRNLFYEEWKKVEPDGLEIVR